jgi:hypothetical protein
MRLWWRIYAFPAELNSNSSADDFETSGWQIFGTKTPGSFFSRSKSVSGSRWCEKISRALILPRTTANAAAARVS